MGFRAFTRRVAVEMKLVGWVRNLPDGRVEAMAGGPMDALSAFEAKLREGPAASLVDEVLVSDGEGEFTEFELRRDG